MNDRLSALRSRDFRLLVAGTTSSALGNAVTPIALAFAVLDLGGSASDLGLVVAAFALAEVVNALDGDERATLAALLKKMTLVTEADDGPV